MRVRLEIQLAPPSIGYVGVELRGGEIGMPEHFLNRAEIRSSLEQVRSEGVAQQVRMDPLGLEPCFPRKSAQNDEDSSARQRPAARVQEQLLSVMPVEVRAASREVVAKGLGSLPPQRDDALLASLAEGPD